MGISKDEIAAAGVATGSGVLTYGLGDITGGLIAGLVETPEKPLTAFQRKMLTAGGKAIFGGVGTAGYALGSGHVKNAGFGALVAGFGGAIWDIITAGIITATKTSSVTGQSMGDMVYRSMRAAKMRKALGGAGTRSGASRSTATSASVGQIVSPLVTPIEIH